MLLLLAVAPSAALADEPLDACSLLTAAEVQAITGMAAQPGVHKETDTVGQQGCGWGTQPYEVQLAVMPSPSGPAVDGLGDSGHPIDGVGDGAEWWWCEACLAADSSRSTNHLVVAQGRFYVDIQFAPTTDAADADSANVQQTHLGWATELARLILPRLPLATKASPSATPSAAPGVPAAGGQVAPGAHPGERPFAATIPAPTEVSSDPMVLLQSALLAALLVLLMPFPSQLFNSTLETHEDEVRRWFRLDRLRRRHDSGATSPLRWLGVAAFILVGALLYAFLDPGFGVDAGSLATFVGMLLGIVLVTVAFAVPLLLAHRRRGDRASLKVVPISLAVAIVCVVVSRLTGFQPGYLYGILIGLVFAQELSAAEEGRATGMAAVLMLVVAIASWLLLAAVPDGDGFGVTVVRTALAALMVAGLEGVVFGLLPMRFLPGESVYRWNRVAWAALLGIGAFAFFHILINPASGYLSDTSRTPLFTVVALLIGFSLVSVAFWGWFRLRGEPERPGADGIA